MLLLLPFPIFIFKLPWLLIFFPVFQECSLTVKHQQGNKKNSNIQQIFVYSILYNLFGYAYQSFITICNVMHIDDQTRKDMEESHQLPDQV